MMSSRQVSNNAKIRSPPSNEGVPSPVPLHRDPSYDWSLDFRNSPTLESKFLHAVPENIRSAATKYQIDLPTEALQWLDSHGGHYEMFADPNLDQIKRWLNTKTICGMSDAEIHSYFEFEKHLHLCDSPRFSCNSRLTPATALNYEKHCRMFWNFLAVIGDYDSMLLLLVPDASRSYCPSVNHQSIISYCNHRYLSAKTPLCNGLSNIPLLDINGKRVLAEGTVNNYHWLKSLFGALSFLHGHRNQEASYREFCQPCHDNFSQGNRNPCPHHGHHLDFSYSGNPIRSVHIKGYISWLERQNQLRGYNPVRRQALLPSDVADIHHYLKGRQYDLQSLKFYVMLLNSLEGAMRYVGFQSVQFSNFEDHSSMWMIYNDVGIEYLVQSVMEKNDQAPQLYKIGFKHRHPKMCFLRHLLVYVHCFSHRVGCLYPRQVCHYNKATTAPVDAGNPSLSDNQPVTYTDCLGWIKTRLKNDCRNTFDGTYKFGTHSLRATFYLFAALGGSEDFGELMRNARHKHEPTARKYYEDAKVIRDEVKRNPTLSAAQDIWPFESRLLQRAGANLERLQRFDPAHLSLSTLADAARVFVEDMLGVTPSNPNYRTPSYLLERSYNTDTKNVRPEIKFEQYLHKIAPPELHAQLLSAFHICSNASIAASNSPNNHQTSPPSNPTPTTSPQHVGALCGHAAEDLNTVTLQMVVFDPVASKKAANMKYYRLADRCLHAITNLKGEIVIRALFRFVVETAKLGIMEATKQKSPRPGADGLYNVAECFDLGHPRLRNERRLFQTTKKKTFLTTFYSCLFHCHGFQLNSFFGAVDTDSFMANAFKGCANCRSEY
ncbi:hypothetical protein IV203_020269 [Nitzschia inconspicua]|uniref:Uncharacterized protein n=1 Tax=Nitzschia inconspicua TaxID=303405 RepID=A0A9K3K6Y6_9STRA|nr:hypothetical protein IV203_020269 [Nitzschia inconspicua]